MTPAPGTPAREYPRPRGRLGSGAIAAIPEIQQVVDAMGTEVQRLNAHIGCFHFDSWTGLTPAVR